MSLPEADFTAAQAVAAGTDYAELKVGAAGLFWNEFRPADGACRLWHWRNEQAYCLTPDGFSARSRVYERGAEPSRAWVYSCWSLSLTNTSPSPPRQKLPPPYS